MAVLGTVTIQFKPVSSATPQLKVFAKANPTPTAKCNTQAALPSPRHPYLAP